MKTDTQSLASLIAESKRILIFTGAGISTGSGISDFRGPQGVWKRRSPVYYDEFMRSESARVEYWDQKLEAWPSFRDAQPNAAHRACARLEEAGRLEALVTQNIDGLHRAGGVSRERIVELHGTNAEIECQSCQRRSEPGPAFEAFEKSRKAPVCECGGFLKPATVSFGQSLAAEDLRRAEKGALAADLALSLGSTLSVHPAASIPLIAVRSGARYVIVNQGATDQDGISGLTLRIEGDVTEVFAEAVDAAVGGG